MLWYISLSPNAWPLVMIISSSEARLDKNRALIGHDLEPNALLNCRNIVADFYHDVGAI